MNCGLPKSMEIGGAEYAIRSDYRPVLDICAALSDPKLDDNDKAQAVMDIFYENPEDIPPEHYNEAIKACFRFINGGEEERQGPKQPRLVDWEQDFPLIVSPVNRVIGAEIRAMEYLHWYSFLSAYQEIGGDCTFAQVVRIRDHLARGKKLDKQDREWYRRNRHLVDLKTIYTEQEESVLNSWLR